MSEQVELKPCPFCGHEAVATQYVVGGRDLVQCTFCSVKTPATNSRKEAVKSWNSRPIEDALRARLSERDVLIERLIEAWSRGNIATLAQLLNEWREKK